MPDLFKLLGTIAVDASSAEKTIDKTSQAASDLAKTMETSGDRFAQAISGKVITKAVALGNIIADLGRKFANLTISIGKDAITAAASIQAETAQFASSFGDLADDANSAFSRIQKDTNIVAGRLKSVGIKAFSQFKGSGLEATEALEKMDTYLRLVADAAAYYDISMEDADTRMRSFLRGNTEAGDMIGLFTSETQRNTYALELYGKKWLELTEAQKQMLMLDVASDIYEQSGAIGQASRESHSWANIIGNLSRSWEEVLAKLGGPLMEQLIPRIEKFSNWLSDNPEKVEALAETIGKIAGVTLDGLIAAFEWITENGDELIAVFEKIGGLFGSIFGFGSNVTVQTKGFDEYTNEQLQVLQEYVDALNALNEAKKEYDQNPFDPLAQSNLAFANDRLGATQMKVDAIEGLLATYNSYLSEQGAADGVYLNVPLKAAEGSEADIQADVSGYKLDGEALIQADPSSGGKIQSFLDSLNLTAVVKLIADASGLDTPDGSHANGLNRVPFDGYRALLHKDEAVLTATEAAVWRGEKRASTIESRSDRKGGRMADITPVTQYITVAKNEDFETGVRNALEMLRWQG